MGVFNTVNDDFWFNGNGFFKKVDACTFVCAVNPTHAFGNDFGVPQSIRNHALGAAAVVIEATFEG